jgi:hypothetical protein
MKQLPLPVRIAAGLAVTAVEQARKLPQQLAGLPVTLVSEALQLSMRAQQHLTDLAIKGDDVLSALRKPEENPEWATFDEDESSWDSSWDAADDGAANWDLADEELADEQPGAEPGETEVDAAGAAGAGEPDEGDLPESGGEPEDESDPWAREERALAAVPSDGDEGGGPALADYDDLSLPQLRAKLRWLGLDELTELLAYEQSHAARPPFLGMLSRRIANVRAQS